MTLIAPLDLQQLFVNTFAGTMLIFVALAMLVIAGMSARFRFPNVVTGTILALFGIMIVGWAGWLYFISIIVGGLIIGYIFARIVKG